MGTSRVTCIAHGNAQLLGHLPAQDDALALLQARQLALDQQRCEFRAHGRRRLPRSMQRQHLGLAHGQHLQFRHRVPLPATPGTAATLLRTARPSPAGCAPAAVTPHRGGQRQQARAQFRFEAVHHREDDDQRGHAHADAQQRHPGDERDEDSGACARPA